MKRTAFISDIFFSFLCTFLFTLCVFRFLGVALFSAFLLAIVCGFLIACTVWAILKSKRNNSFLKKADEQKKQKLLLHLALLNKSECLDFFIPIISPQAFAKKINDSYLQTERSVYLVQCTFAPVNADTIAAFFRLNTQKERIVLCLKIEESALALCQKLGIQVQTENEIYTLVKESNLFPEQFLGELPSVKLPYFKRKPFFYKSNSKRFFGSGALVLVASLITPFPYYYLIFGAILLLVATFVRIFGRE